MKRTFALFILICGVASSSLGQDSASNRNGEACSSHQKNVQAHKSVTTAEDSLSKVHNLFSNPEDPKKRIQQNSTMAKHKYDSLQMLSKQDKLSSAADTISKMFSTPSNRTNSFQDILRQKVENFDQHRVDTLDQNLNEPIENINSKLSERSEGLKQKKDIINDDITEKSNKLESNNQAAFDKATDGSINSPMNPDGNGGSLPGKESSINLFDISDASKRGGIPEANIPNQSIEDLKTQVGLQDIKHKASLEIQQVESIKNTTNTLSEGDSKLKELGRYENDIKGLKQMDSASVNNLSSKVEDRVADIDEVKAVSEQKNLLTKQQLEYHAMMQRYQDKKLLKDEIARKTRNVVNGKVDKFAPTFKEAQANIAKAKKLNSNVEQYKDGKIKRENEMKDKPFYERVVLGVTLQVYNKEVFIVDWGIQVGYKLSNRIMAGAGGIYRMNASDKYDTYVSSAGIYGYRLFGDVNIKKGFYAHGELESLTVRGFVHPNTQIEIPLQSAYSAYVGIGKRYDISKKVRGSAIILYRAEFVGNVPSMNKINLRIGFDLNTKKRTRMKTSKNK